VVQTQNPDLRNLEKVIRNKESLYSLRSTGVLEIALDKSIPDKSRLQDSLFEAKSSLQKAHSLFVTGFDGEKELLTIAGQIANIADDLYSKMEKKYNEGTGSPKSRITD